MLVAMDTRDAIGPQPRGWGRYARSLASALQERPDLSFRSLPGAGWRGPEALWEQVGFPAAARGASVLHAPSVFLPLARRCPGVVTIHDLAFEVYPEDFAPRTRAKFRLLAPRAARSAERVICVSAFTCDDVCERYGLDPARVRVVHNAPSLRLRGQAPPVQGAPYLLGVGDLRGKKNWARLARAWQGLRAEYRLVIAGLGDAPELRALGVELPGYVDDAQLDALIRGAACLVHPSLYEGYGLVVAEAVERGVRVAAAGNTALPEAGGDQAVYFDPFDVDAIGAAIRAALAGPAPRPTGRTWADVAKETVAVYREAAGS